LRKVNGHFLSTADNRAVITNNYETLPFTNVKKFQVKQDQIFFSFENELHRYQMKTLDEKGIVLPDSTDAIDLRLENNRLYLLTKDELKFYTY